MSTATAGSVVPPEEFIEPGRRLFIDTNVFMDTDPGRDGGLKTLFHRCAGPIRSNSNPIVVPSKIVDELTKQSLIGAAGLSEERMNAVKKAGNALVFLDAAQAAGLVRKDLGDISNPYADDLFIEVFKRAAHRYEMCLLTNDIDLRIRVRLLAAETDRRLLAGVLSREGLIEFESDQALYERGARKLERKTRNIDEGSGEAKDRRAVASLSPLLAEFQETFRLKPARVIPGERGPARRPKAADAGATSVTGAFSRAPRKKAPDRVLEEAAIPEVGDEVYYETTPGGRVTLVLGEVLGTGGEGTVFSVNGDSSMVVKVFDAEHRTVHRQKKLALLSSRGLEREGIAFPTGLIANRDGKFVGYAMPRASGRELQATVMRPSRFRKAYPNWTKADLVDVCISFLEKVAYLHSLNILLGDINPKNVIVDANKDVWIIDADSWQLEGYPCPVGTPMFTAPSVTGEYADSLRTQQEELFAVATMLFMILITGQFPYARAGADGGDFAGLIKEGKFTFQFHGPSDRDQPEGNWRFMWSHLPFPVKRMFWNTFHRDGGRYAKRPTANEWLGVFRQYRQFFGSPDDFDPMSNDVYPTRFRAMNSATPIYECAKCHASMVGRWQDDRQSFWEPELCADCYQDLPRCSGCGKPKSPEALRDGRCWACNRRRAEELDSSRVCRDCGQPYITYKHVEWFKREGLEVARSHAAIKEQCPPGPRALSQRSPKATPGGKKTGSRPTRATPASRPVTSSPVGQRQASRSRKGLWARLVEWWDSL